MSNSTENVQNEPFARVIKRAELSAGKTTLLRLSAVLLSLIAGGVFIACVGQNPFVIYGTILSGAFRSMMAFQGTIKLMIPLLISSLGVTLAFKMKFWNIGAEGQIIFGATCATFFALFCSGMNHVLLIIVMFLAGFIGGGLWGLIPAIFKVKYSTNETFSFDSCHRDDGVRRLRTGAEVHIRDCQGSDNEPQKYSEIQACTGRTRHSRTNPVCRHQCPKRPQQAVLGNPHRGQSPNTRSHQGRNSRSQPVKQDGKRMLQGVSGGDVHRQRHRLRLLSYRLRPAERKYDAVSLVDGCGIRLSRQPGQTHRGAGNSFLQSNPGSPGEARLQQRLQTHHLHRFRLCKRKSQGKAPGQV